MSASHHYLPKTTKKRLFVGVSFLGSHSITTEEAYYSNTESATSSMILYYWKHRGKNARRAVLSCLDIPLAVIQNISQACCFLPGTLMILRILVNTGPFNHTYWKLSLCYYVIFFFLLRSHSHVLKSLLSVMSTCFPHTNSLKFS